ncbi:Hypothetical_protein [Hexamita inflata]|uniref:Hypothetical_protein n=1 Tax=Hexamita inflata TaxID=28002 RepID=A0AA86TV42_9EUKA|nr:Hypothetical protein HINF_LOCUS17670 [Hexamita inflata]
MSSELKRAIQLTSQTLFECQSQLNKCFENRSKLQNKYIQRQAQELKINQVKANSKKQDKQTLKRIDDCERLLIKHFERLESVTVKAAGGNIKFNPGEPFRNDLTPGVGSMSAKVIGRRYD